RNERRCPSPPPGRDGDVECGGRGAVKGEEALPVPCARGRGSLHVSIPDSVGRIRCDFEFLACRSTVSVPFSNLDRLPAPLVSEKMPDATAASCCKKLQLSATPLAPQERQHRLWLSASKPLGLGHGAITPSQESGPAPSTLEHAALALDSASSRR